MPTKAPEFVQIPSPVIKSKAVKAGDKFVFGFIAWFCTLDEKECTASNETLGAMSGLEPRSVSNSVRRLKQAGFIVVKYTGDPRSSKTKRSIKSLVNNKKSVTSNDVTRQQRKVTSNDVTRDINRSTKGEDIRRTKREYGSSGLKMPDLTGDFYDKFDMRKRKQNA